VGESCIQFCFLVIDIKIYSYVISFFLTFLVNSRAVTQLGTVARLGRLIGHVMSCMALRHGSSVRQVAGPRHAVFGCAVREFG
jgi:hypothetical protein